uniref:porin family protein n=1 Tax=Flavobacterium sp. TaxID=239 RepID=UPI00404B5616
MLLLFVITTTFSQEGMFLGVNSGLTYSKFRGSNFFKNMSSQLDFFVGASFDIQLKQRLLLSTNMSYERNSMKRYYATNSLPPLIPIGQDPSSFSVPRNKFQTRFEYINIPITLKYLLNFEKKLYINGGGYVSYLLDVKNIDNGRESDIDFNNQFKKIDYGLVLGIGYNFISNPTSFFSIEVRDSYGLTKIGESDSFGFESTKRNSLNLILNYHLKI